MLRWRNKPYYNPRTLGYTSGLVKGKSRLSKPAHAPGQSPRQTAFLRIGDVARRVGVSPSVLRTWESLGLVRPRRSGSQYRLYTPADLRVLKRARFLRRVRGLNPRAVVHVLRSQGLLAASTQTAPSPLGARLRRTRLERKLSLAKVAGACGVSIGFLSAIERGQMSASVSTLRRLARFYNLNILALFEPSEGNPHRVQLKERKVLEAGPGVRMELLAWGNAVMEPHLFRIAPGAGSGEAYAHDGEEFLHVIRGRLDITLNGGSLYKLAEGDSFYFESNTPHRWVNPGRKETQVLWVNTPPTF
jgi:DNA-binding transcriptional MerR regulator/quercetin dioxygenase-like cupin family protein